MRIRKHANISALLLSATNSSTTTILKLQPHVCQLNQSPWDVPDATFSPPSTPPPPPPPLRVHSIQVKHDDNAKETSPDSISISPVKREENVSCGLKSDSSNRSDDTAVVETDEQVVLCCKNDGKSWRCRREAVNGGAMCEHHLFLARNHNSHGSNKVKRAVVPPEVAFPETTEKRRPRPRRVSTSSNPYDFYYYSGFGPRWGKRRGKDHEEDNGISTCSTHNVPTVSSASDVAEYASSSSQSIIREIDYIDDDDEEEEEEEDDQKEELYKRKRARKPVKARSLKSLTM